MKLNIFGKSILIAASVAAIASSAHANIGDTYQKSVDRYGQPWKNLGNGWVLWATDKNNTVNEKFGPDGRCIAIEYRRYTGVNYGEAELSTRISQNLPTGGSFTEIPVDLGRAWQTKDGSFTAVLMIEEAKGQGRIPVMLSIWSPAMHQAYEAAVAADEKAKAEAAPTPALVQFEKVSVGELVPQLKRVLMTGEFVRAVAPLLLLLIGPLVGVILWTINHK